MRILLQSPGARNHFESKVCVNDIPLEGAYHSRGIYVAILDGTTGKIKIGRGFYTFRTFTYDSVYHDSSRDLVDLLRNAQFGDIVLIKTYDNEKNCGLGEGTKYWSSAVINLFKDFGSSEIEKVGIGCPWIFCSQIEGAGRGKKIIEARGEDPTSVVVRSAEILLLPEKQAKEKEDKERADRAAEAARNAAADTDRLRQITEAQAATQKAREEVKQKEIKFQELQKKLQEEQGAKLEADRKLAEQQLKSYEEIAETQQQVLKETIPRLRDYVSFLGNMNTGSISQETLTQLGKQVSDLEQKIVLKN